MSGLRRLSGGALMAAALTLLASVSRAGDPPRAPATPKVLWTARLGSAGMTAPPAIAGDRVVVGTGMSGMEVLAFDPATGKKVWSYRAKDNGPGAIVLSGDRVHFTTESCTHYALEAKTGRVVWSVWLGDPVLSSPAVVGDRVFVSSGRAQRRLKSGQTESGVFLDCRNERNGSLIWTAPIGREILQAPIVVGDTVFCSTQDGRLHALSAPTGEERWSGDLKATSAPTATASGLFVTTDGGTKLLRLDHDGRTRWSVTLTDWPGGVTENMKIALAAARAGMTSVPCVVGDRVYVGTSAGRLMCLSDSDGSEIWSREIVAPPAPQNARQAALAGLAGVTALGSPCVVHGRVYGGAADGTVWCASAEDGAPIWKYKGPGPVGWSPCISGGRVYVTSDDGTLTCLDAGDPAADGWGQWGGTALHTGGAGPILPPIVITPDEPEEE